MLHKLKTLDITKIMWWQWILIAAGAVLLLQLFIPAGTISFRAKLDGELVQASRIQKLESQLADKKLNTTLILGPKTIKVEYAETGIKIDAKKTVSRVPTVTWVDKLIPFKALIKLVSARDVAVVRSVNNDQLSNYSKIIADQNSFSAKDATITVTATAKMSVKKESNGLKFSPKAVASTLRTVPVVSAQKHTVLGTTLKPVITASMYTHVRKDFDALKDKTLVVTYGDKRQALEAKDFMPLLEVVPTDKANTFKLQFKATALELYSTNWGKDYNVAAGITQVTYYDSTETERRTGSTGRMIDVAKVKQQLQNWIIEPTGEPIALAVTPVAPRIVATRLYSASSAGLQAKLNDWIKQHGGGYQVAIQEMGGQGRIASYNVAKQTVMASTYKLFVAYAAYTQAENGALNLNTVVSNGLTIEQCISRAIINSDNTCAIAIGKYIGWAKIDQLDAAAGFASVHLNNYDAAGNLTGDKLVNAGELAKFLVQLSQGSLINSEHTGSLLSYMKQQVYRSGIPAGSHGSVVADKVGFLDAYTHDAGIVWAPKATYALVIMSDGANNWSNIKDLASAVYDFMNQ